MDNSLLITLGALCLVIVSVSMLRRSERRSATKREVTREQLARLRDQREISGSLDDLLVQIEECARRVNAQVDTRFAKLEALLRDADERIAALQAAGGSPRAADIASAPAAARAGASASNTRTPSTSTAESAAAVDPIREFIPGWTPTEEPPPPLGLTPRPRLPADAGMAVPKSRAERFDRIYKLADGGTTPLAIADALQLPLGEVELILNLRKAQG